MVGLCKENTEIPLPPEEMISLMDEGSLPELYDAIYLHCIIIVLKIDIYIMLQNQT